MGSLEARDEVLMSLIAFGAELVSIKFLFIELLFHSIFVCFTSTFNCWDKNNWNKFGC